MARSKRTSRPTTEVQEPLVVEVEQGVQEETPEPVISEATAAPVSEPIQLTTASQYQADSVQYWYRRTRDIDLLVTPVAPHAFTLTPAGELNAAYGDNQYVPTEDDRRDLVDWLLFRWDGDLAYSGVQVTLTCVGAGDFRPSGGGRPRSITEL